jgi:MFS family permease
MLGWFLHRAGFRVVMTVGALAYFARYFVWSMTDLPVSVLVTSQVLHGMCYACFFASAFIYVDRIASEDIRHSAQTVFGIIILGGGPVLGGWLSGALGDRYTIDGVLDFGPLWSALSWMGLLAAVLLFLLFRDPFTARVETDAGQRVGPEPAA